MLNTASTERFHAVYPGCATAPHPLSTLSKDNGLHSENTTPGGGSMSGISPCWARTSTPARTFRSSNAHSRPSLSPAKGTPTLCCIPRIPLPKSRPKTRRNNQKYARPHLNAQSGNIAMNSTYGGRTQSSHRSLLCPPPHKPKLVATHIPDTRPL